MKIRRYINSTGNKVDVGVWINEGTKVENYIEFKDKSDALNFVGDEFYLRDEINKVRSGKIYLVEFTEVSDYEGKSKIKVLDNIDFRNLMDDVKFIEKANKVANEFSKDFDSILSKYRSKRIDADSEVVDVIIDKLLNSNWSLTNRDLRNKLYDSAHNIV